MQFRQRVCCTVRVDGGDPSTASTRMQRNRAARIGIVDVSRQSAISKLVSSQFGDLFSIFSCFITRSSIMAANDIDSGSRDAVARRAC
ncbi:hypothetical protein Y032_0609g613 [Ancylostoma ceylanicum]|uniref:Uncharacterized protein n=1 Tax=Ancylostoma ceylanicum TaxID=53326 RepID=A0A016WMM5_9BILA|nr:hypothetical protein Y032_0609g613 [Ancylostoma ceylanicum]